MDITTNSPLEEIGAEIQNDPDLLNDFSENIGNGEMPRTQSTRSFKVPTALWYASFSTSTASSTQRRTQCLVSGVIQCAP